MDCAQKIVLDVCARSRNRCSSRPWQYTRSIGTLTRQDLTRNPYILASSPTRTSICASTIGSTKAAEAPSPRLNSRNTALPLISPEAAVCPRGPDSLTAACTNRSRKQRRLDSRESADHIRRFVSHQFRVAAKPAEDWPLSRRRCGLGASGRSRRKLAPCHS